MVSKFDISRNILSILYNERLRQRIGREVIPRRWWKKYNIYIHCPCRSLNSARAAVFGSLRGLYAPTTARGGKNGIAGGLSDYLYIHVYYYYYHHIVYTHADERDTVTSL